MNVVIGAERARRHPERRYRSASEDQAVPVWWLLGVAAFAAVAWATGIALLQWITLD